MQLSFSPTKYNFKWTEDGWYEWDYDAAHKAALKARDARARELKAKGYEEVRKSSQRDCLMSLGGIGTQYPHIELVVTVYRLEATSPAHLAKRYNRFGHSIY